MVTRGIEQAAAEQSDRKIICGRAACESGWLCAGGDSELFVCSLMELQEFSELVVMCR